jgi:hypothetical protein
MKDFSYTDSLLVVMSSAMSRQKTDSDLATHFSRSHTRFVPGVAPRNIDPRPKAGLQ